MSPASETCSNSDQWVCNNTVCHPVLRHHSSFSLPSAGMFLSNVVENIKLEGVEPQSASPETVKQEVVWGECRVVGNPLIAIAAGFGSWTHTAGRSCSCRGSTSGSDSESPSTPSTRRAVYKKAAKINRDLADNMDTCIVK